MTKEVLGSSPKSGSLLGGGWGGLPLSLLMLSFSLSQIIKSNLKKKVWIQAKRVFLMQMIIALFEMQATEIF